MLEQFKLLEQFKERIIAINGIEAFRRMQEQLHSGNHSNCAGLTAYILGLQKKNLAVSIPIFMSEFVHPNMLGVSDLANVCMFESIPGDDLPAHIAIYLGRLNDRIYTFEQTTREKPEVKDYPRKWRDALPGVQLVDVPAFYYKIPHSYQS